MASVLVLLGPGDPFGKLVLLVLEIVPQWLEILYRPTLNGQFIFFSLMVLFLGSPSYKSSSLQRGKGQ